MADRIAYASSQELWGIAGAIEGLSVLHHVVERSIKGKKDQIRRPARNCPKWPQLPIKKASNVQTGQVLFYTGQNVPIKVNKVAQWLYESAWKKGAIYYFREPYVHTIHGSNVPAGYKGPAGNATDVYCARAYLKITDIRLQKLWDVTEEEVYREGFTGKDLETMNLGIQATRIADMMGHSKTDLRHCFWWLWNDLYGTTPYNVIENPTVEVLTYETVIRE